MPVMRSCVGRACSRSSSWTPSARERFPAGDRGFTSRDESEIGTGAATGREGPPDGRHAVRVDLGRRRARVVEGPGDDAVRGRLMRHA
jgi:hypothetical protein